MLIHCPSCGKAFETTATWGPKSTTTCPACGRVVVLREASAASPDRGEGTVPLDSGTHAYLQPLEGEHTAVASKGLGLALPPGKRVSLLQLSGPRKGELIPVTKPRMVLGREGGNADAALKDPEVSRAHAAFECYGPRMLVRDLGSRNGTFVKEQKVETAPLEDHSEFRVGSTILMVLLTDAE
jgi:endogenous inhibitor of DNA gyrase (YacG/DUF329 family)